MAGWLAGYVPLALTHVDSIRSLGSSSHAMHACMSFVSRTIFLFSLSLSRFIWAGTEQVCLPACLPHILSNTSTPVIPLWGWP